MSALPDRLLGGFGVVGAGIGGDPPPFYTRPDLCASQGHPGCTYNPWMDKTWCLCGQRVQDGNQFTHSACCGGPLTSADSPERRAA